MNIQQKVSHLAMKKKIQENQAETKQNTYEDIKSTLTEDQQRLIEKYYGQLSSLGFKKEEDVYTLCRKYEFNEKILDDHVKVLITKSREASDDASNWVTVGSSKHGAPAQSEKEHTNKQNKPYKNRNEGGYNANKGGYVKRQYAGEQGEYKHQRKYEENDHEQEGHREKDKYYQKPYRNENSYPQEENGSYQKKEYKQRERNYNAYKNKDFDSRKEQNVVYYAKKEDSNTEPVEPTTTTATTTATKKEDVKPEHEKTEQPKHTEKTKEEAPQSEKPKTESQEQRTEQRGEKKGHQSEVSAERYRKEAKRGKNEKYVYSVKKENTDESGSTGEKTQPSTTKTETKESTKQHVETPSDIKKQQEHYSTSSGQSNDSSRYRKISPNRNVEYVQKEQKQAPPKQQETSLETQNKESEKQQLHYQQKSNDYQKTQGNKNISVQNASQTSYTPTTTTNTSSSQNYGTTKPEMEELPKNVKTLGQTSSGHQTSSGLNQGNVYGQINSFPPGNLQGLPTTTQNPQGGMPMFFNPQQQMPQTFIPPFNPFPVTTTQGQTEQKDIPSIFQMPYIVFPQPNGTAIIQPLYFSSGLPQMMPGQPTTMPGFVNPMATTTQTQFQKPNTNQFDLENIFRAQSADSTNKPKSTSNQGNDKTNDSNAQKNASNLQESNLFYPFYMPNQQMQFPQNPMGQFKPNNA